jgi:hypothetical protein
MGSYLSPAETGLELVILVAVYLDVGTREFLPLVVAIGIVLTALSGIVGHAHKKWQQDTDARLNITDVMVNEIAKVVVHQMKEERLLIRAERYEG